MGKGDDADCQFSVKMVLRSTEICRAAFGNGIDMLIPETFQSVCWTQTRTGRISETNMKNANMIKKVGTFDNTRLILSPYDRILRLRKVPTFVPLCYQLAGRICSILRAEVL